MKYIDDFNDKMKRKCMLAGYFLFILGRKVESLDEKKSFILFFIFMLPYFK